MTTLNETYKTMLANPDHWEVPFMDFVDEFRRTQSQDMINEFICIEQRFDNLITATVLFLCDELGTQYPEWHKSVQPLTRPWFVSGIENLKAIAIAESPAQFRIRNIFVLDNFLSRT